MGYTFRIGNAVPVFSKDDGELYAGWQVKPARHVDAPIFMNDEMTGDSNMRSPSYSAWADFCRETGLYDFFFDDRGNLWAGHPGCVMITADDLAVVRSARETWQATHDLPPGFDGDPYYDDEVGAWVTPEGGKYDYQLARLLWLEWWMQWAIDNCETPAIQNT